MESGGYCIRVALHVIMAYNDLVLSESLICTRFKGICWDRVQCFINHNDTERISTSNPVVFKRWDRKHDHNMNGHS